MSRFKFRRIKKTKVGPNTRTTEESKLVKGIISGVNKGVKDGMLYETSIARVEGSDNIEKDMLRGAGYGAVAGVSKGVLDSIKNKGEEPATEEKKFSKIKDLLGKADKGVQDYVGLADKPNTYKAIRNSIGAVGGAAAVVGGISKLIDKGIEIKRRKEIAKNVEESNHREESPKRKKVVKKH